MKLLSRAIKFMKMTVISAVVSAAALALIPLGSVVGEKGETILSFLLAGIFWMGLLLVPVFFCLASAARKKLQRDKSVGRKLIKRSLGIISFGKNREALVADLVLAVTFITIVLLIVLQVQNAWAVTFTLGLFLLSFILHCIFNGTSYRYIKAFREKKEETKNRENT